MNKYAANLSMLFNEVEFLEKFTLAKENGFEGVEYLFPYDFDKDDIKAELEKMLIREKRMDLYESCIKFLDTRIKLDQSGFKFDIFEH